MLRRVQRHVDPERRTELACPHPGTYDDNLSFDAAFVRLRADRSTFMDQNFGDLYALEDFGAAVAGAAGQRLCRIRRVRHTVRGYEVCGH